MAIDILLLDAQFRQSLACLRVYARRGLSVGCAVCQSERRPIAFASRYGDCRLRLPDFAEDASAYADALLGMIDEHRPSVVIPAHDGSIEAIRLRRPEIESRTALALAADAALDIAINKEKTLAIARELGIYVPEGVTATTLDDVRAAGRALGYPVVIKPSESWAQGESGRGKRLYSTIARNEAEALYRADRIFSRGVPALIQTWLSGRREAVAIFYARGEIVAKFAQMSYREWPILGGASVFYESLPLLSDITGAAERLVSRIGLEGCSLVEFRRDRHGRPALMEINPRMAGSVGLAISCGVNFPELVFSHALGRPLMPVRDYAVGRRMRWLAGDIRNLQSAYDDRDHPDAVPVARAIGTFVADFVVRPSKLDTLELTDPKPALVEMQNVVLDRLVHRAATLFRPRPPASEGKDW